MDKPNIAQEPFEKYIQEKTFFFHIFSERVKNHTWEQDRILVWGFRNFLSAKYRETLIVLQDKYKNPCSAIITENISISLRDATNKCWVKYFDTLPQPPIGGDHDSDETMLASEAISDWEEKFVSFCSDAQTEIMKIAQSVYPEGKYLNT